ncbi:hypothetical protein PTTG_11727 [Puccinia triticina 1-1 BBBD Race 1]|uniref:RING-type domain-containing protein n=1 Tax=Puccinia triticina (isolate 1-1 / race 1 (BBBD)) TaxID=630390 RepID=A0A180H5E2_PUCT1|nr:hypothetical protein PTTG_11727 [Puccinia triticina 1-1 BBBD Race 1]
MVEALLPTLFHVSDYSFKVDYSWDPPSFKQILAYPPSLFVGRCLAMDHLDQLNRVGLKEGQDFTSSQDFETASSTSDHEPQRQVAGLARPSNPRNSEENREPLILSSSHPEHNRNIIADVPDTCPICLAEWGSGEKITSREGCGHEFHKICIEEAKRIEPVCPTRACVWI